MTAVTDTQPPADTAVAKRLPEVRSITGLRIVAAVWVLLFHWKFTPLPDWGGVRAFLTPVTDSGHLGVDLFYVISGFVITLTYLDTMGRRPRLRGWLDFWWARVCRVWPAYAVVVVLFGCWLLWRRSIDPAFYAHNAAREGGWDAIVLVVDSASAPTALHAPDGVLAALAPLASRLLLVTLPADTWSPR